MRRMFSQKQIEEMIAKAVNKGKEEVLNEIATNGVDKVNPQALVGLTHSFAELDETLQALVQSAIEAEDGVICTQAQWNVIKDLLDKSLYLNYEGYSLIKSMSNGINKYCFGANIPGNVYSGMTALEIVYVEVDQNLNIYASEL